MKLQVKIIGPLIYAVGFSEKEMDVAEGITPDGLTALLGLPKDRPRIVTRNGAAVASDEPLAEGDKIAVSPIYSGG
jgi:sulfur carrier protein ThiS